MEKKITDFDAATVQKLFCEYVDNLDSKPRHTGSAIREIGLFGAFVAGAFPMNSKLQDCLYDRMMSCAVEFEESGFVAGFMYAVSLMKDC